MSARRVPALRWVAVLALGLTGFTEQAVLAQVVLDGSLRAGTEGPVPNVAPPGSPAHYAIDAELGVASASGSHLFHSFRQLDVQGGEHATFSGPPGVEHVIARVTGGLRSEVNGTLEVAIDGADLLLMNPSGVLFGPGATLEVDGAVHVTSADFVDFGEGRRFEARTEAGAPLLAMAPAATFGFLAAAPASIAVSGDALSAAAGATLALVGGDLVLGGSAAGAARLTAPGGRLELVAVASPGQAPLGDDGPRVEAFERLGRVSLGGGTRLDVSRPVSTPDAGDARVVIRGGSLVAAPAARIFADTRGAQDGGGVAIEAREEITLDDARVFSRSLDGTGRAGDITLASAQIEIVGGGRLETSTRSNRPAADVRVQAGERVRIAGSSGGDDPARSGILVRTRGAAPAGTVSVSAPSVVLAEGGFIQAGNDFAFDGDAGRIEVQSGTLDLSGGSSIDVTSFSRGDGGSIVVQAAEAVRIAGRGSSGRVSQLSSQNLNGVSAGSIRVTTPRLEIDDGGGITTATLGRSPGGLVDLEVEELRMVRGGVIDSGSEANGRGGDVRIRASGPVALSGQGATGIPSSIVTSAFGAGDAGDVTIGSRSLSLSGGARITASTGETGLFGGAGTGLGGTIAIEAGSVELRRGSAISTRSVGTGNAGRILVQTDRMHLEGSSIGSEALNSFGGSIAINGEAVLELPGDRLQALKSPGQRPGFLVHLEDSEITTSVGQGVGDGGNVLIDPTFLVLENSRIAARAGGAGDGGNILLVADFVLADRPLDEMLDASSALGVAGTIEVTAPDVDLAGTLATLPESFLDAGSLLRETCGARRPGQASGSFTVVGRSATPPTADGLLPAAHEAAPTASVRAPADAASPGLLPDPARVLRVTCGG
jgi:filamentous hemagglutinin family protein